MPSTLVKVTVVVSQIHLKKRELSLAYCKAVPFSIIAVDVLDRLSLGDRFQTPIFFSSIVIVSFDIQSLLGQ